MISDADAGRILLAVMVGICLELIYLCNLSLCIIFTVNYDALVQRLSVAHLYLIFVM